MYSLGGAGFVLKLAKSVIYIDPFLADQEPRRPMHRAIPPPFYAEEVRTAHALLSTHEHNDHCNEPTVKAFSSNTRAIFMGPTSSCKKSVEWGYPKNRMVALTPGDVHHLTPEVNVRAFESNDPYAESALMFLISTGNVTILHSGDSSYFDGFARIGSNHRIDVALLNFGKQIPTPEKPFYMNAESVARAASDLGARIVVPMHWDIWVEVKEGPALIVPHLKARSPRSSLRILKVGDNLELP